MKTFSDHTNREVEKRHQDEWNRIHLVGKRNWGKGEKTSNLGSIAVAVDLEEAVVEGGRSLQGISRMMLETFPMLGPPGGPSTTLLGRFKRMISWTL